MCIERHWDLVKGAKKNQEEEATETFLSWSWLWYIIVKESYYKIKIDNVFIKKETNECFYGTSVPVRLSLYVRGMHTEWKYYVNCIFYTDGLLFIWLCCGYLYSVKTYNVVDERYYRNWWCQRWSVTHNQTIFFIVSCTFFFALFRLFIVRCDASH